MNGPPRPVGPDPENGPFPLRLMIMKISSTIMITKMALIPVPFFFSGYALYSFWVARMIASAPA